MATPLHSSKVITIHSPFWNHGSSEECKFCETGITLLSKTHGMPLRHARSLMTGSWKFVELLADTTRYCQNPRCGGYYCFVWKHAESVVA